MTTASEKKLYGARGRAGLHYPRLRIARPRFCCGMSQRASNFLTIPLCHEHHAGALSIHKSPRQFEKLFGSEVDLLAETIRRLA